MKKVLLLLFSLVGILNWSVGQVYLDQFDNDDPAFTTGGFTFSEANGELTVTGDGTGGPWDPFVYQPHDATAGTASVVDATGNNKVFVRAKASSIGTQLRLDLKNVDGYATTEPAQVKTLTTDFMILEYNFTGVMDGGYGGTSCTMGPCPVTLDMIQDLLFFINPGTGTFNGTVVIDYISFGEEPTTVIMSDVFQDHFDTDSSATNVSAIPGGFTSTLDIPNSEIVWTGDGTSLQWEPFSYVFRNPVTYDTIDIDVSGNNKMYVRAKASQAGTVLRFDLLDIDGFATTQGSIGKVLSDEYVTYEYDYSGTFIDLGYGGTPCTPATAPCPVDPTRIASMTVFVDPGGTEFLGSVSIDYISFGTALEATPPPGIPTYGDHFNNSTTTLVVDAPGFVSTEMDSEMTITGDGAGAPYSAIAYNPHDQVTGEPLIIDATGNNKMYIRAKASVDVPLRIDLVDTTGFLTNQPAFTKFLTSDFQEFEFDFTGQYIDGGFGGPPCDPGPCVVDGSVIQTVLLYPNPVDGGYAGEITIDYLSFGAPMGPDLGPVGVPNYQDNYDNDDLSFITDNSGFVSSISNSDWTITGDGMAGAYTPVTYDLHDQVNGMSILGSVSGSNDKIYVRARASIDQTMLRMDLQDNLGYVTSNPSVERALTTDYTIIEFDYTGTYADGGFGGTPCDANNAPCPVDGQRINQLQLFVDAATGAFNGTVDIDWISFGSPILNLGPTGVINYADDYLSDDLTNIADNGDFVSAIANGEWTITGAGGSGAYTPVSYSAHDLTTNDSLAVDAVGSNDKLYVRAKSTVDGTPLRIDLQDSQGFVTSNPSVSQNLTTDYAVYIYDYVGTYTDGGFGGTPCTAGPCAVDGQRITDLQFFPDPDAGAFNGTITIDWISFGQELMTNVEEIANLESLSVYPNPASDELGISLELAEQSEVAFRLYDRLGRLVLKKTPTKYFSGQQFERLNVSDLSGGMYFLQINVDGQSTQAIQIVIE